MRLRQSRRPWRSTDSGSSLKSSVSAAAGASVAERSLVVAVEAASVGAAAAGAVLLGVAVLDSAAPGWLATAVTHSSANRNPRRRKRYMFINRHLPMRAEGTGDTPQHPARITPGTA